MTEAASPLRPPFPAFGGKARIAPAVWQRLGVVANYVEPFVNSAAVGLASPYVPAIETWNDLNGQVANFWRAVRSAPDAVAHHAGWPVSEVDLHARHAWLVQRQEALTARLMGDPGYFDAQTAGWWLWGICSWIGSGWCSGRGPWTVNAQGRLVSGTGTVVWRQQPHLGNGGQGINRRLPHLGDGGQGACADWSEHLRQMMGRLADRLRRVRVCCGDWTRVCGPAPTTHNGLTAVFLDPPYQIAGRDAVYDNHDAHPDGANSAVFYRVVDWARAHGDDPLLRIAVCGYDEPGLFPATWERLRWKAVGGYGSQAGGPGRANAHRETVWFSPDCLRPPEQQQLALWSVEGEP